MNLNLQLPSPLQKIEHPLLRKREVELYFKREDLIHPTVSGNKWRKLKYNLTSVKENDFSGIITFGGAFSNHIYSTAAACQLYQINGIGLIRGEDDVDNPTLSFARSVGMDLHFLSRSEYRLKEAGSTFKKMKQKHSNYLLIPEGGSNVEGLRGCVDMGTELNDQLDFVPDYYLISAGTGCTAAGLIQSAEVKEKILINSVLKGDFLQAAIDDFLPHQTYPWELLSQYHFGGYGKVKDELIQFINAFKNEAGIALDPIYNGKSVFALFDLIEKGHFNKGDRIVYIHTGGLQGIKGWNYRNPGKMIN